MDALQSALAGVVVLKGSEERRAVVFVICTRRAQFSNESCGDCVSLLLHKATHNFTRLPSADPYPRYVLCASTVCRRSSTRMLPAFSDICCSCKIELRRKRSTRTLDATHGGGTNVYVYLVID